MNFIGDTIFPHGSDSLGKKCKTASKTSPGGSKIAFLPIILQPSIIQVAMYAASGNISYKQLIIKIFTNKQKKQATMFCHWLSISYNFKKTRIFAQFCCSTFKRATIATIFIGFHKFASDIPKKSAPDWGYSTLSAFVSDSHSFIAVNRSNLVYHIAYLSFITFIPCSISTIRMIIAKNSVFIIWSRTPIQKPGIRGLHRHTTSRDTPKDITENT